MKIVVIGDYYSPKYKDLLLTVKIAKPDEEIIDLSKSELVGTRRSETERLNLISASGLAVIGEDWKNCTLAKTDVDILLRLGKNMVVQTPSGFHSYSHGTSLI